MVYFICACSFCYATTSFLTLRYILIHSTHNIHLYSESIYDVDVPSLLAHPYPLTHITLIFTFTLFTRFYVFLPIVLSEWVAFFIASRAPYLNTRKNTAIFSVSAVQCLEITKSAALLSDFHSKCWKALRKMKIYSTFKRF